MPLSSRLWIQPEEAAFGKKDLLKIVIVLVLTNTVLNNFKRIRWLEYGQPVSKHNHRV